MAGLQSNRDLTPGGRRPTLCGSQHPTCQQQALQPAHWRSNNRPGKQSCASAVGTQHAHCAQERHRMHAASCTVHNCNQTQTPNQPRRQTRSCTKRLGGHVNVRHACIPYDAVALQKFAAAAAGVSQLHQVKEFMHGPCEAQQGPA